MEFKETTMKISSMQFYLSPNYIASTKIDGKNYSAITLPYFYSIGTTYSVNVNLSTNQDAILSGKFSGDILFTSPTSKGFNIYIPNNTNDAYDCTLFINVVGKQGDKMVLKFYKNGYDPNKKYILYKKIDNANGTMEYYKEIEKTKEELYVEDLQGVKEQLNAAQEAIDFLIEMGGDV